MKKKGMMKHYYRVSDGAESEYVEADSPEEARDEVFGAGYDWGDTPEDLQEEDCVTATGSYTVWEQDGEGEDVGFPVLSGPLSDVR